MVQCIINCVFKIIVHLQPLQCIINHRNSINRRNTFIRFLKKLNQTLDIYYQFKFIYNLLLNTKITSKWNRNKSQLTIITTPNSFIWNFKIQLAGRFHSSFGALFYLSTTFSSCLSTFRYYYTLIFQSCFN